MNDDYNTQFFHKISRFQKLYSRSLSNRLGPYGVSPGYLAILERLWDNDGVTQKQLHGQLDVEQATLSNTLRRMERDGLVRMDHDRADRRHKHIFLTDKASQLQSAVATAVRDLQEVVNKGLTINDLRYFNRILRQMDEQVANDLEDPFLMLFDEIPDQDS